MRPSHLITVQAVLPPELEALDRLARNLAWTWDERVARLFERLDPAHWERTNRNPLQLLRHVDQRRLKEAVADAELRRELAAADANLLALETVDQPDVCYFSAEFALAESLPIYAGGLGVLAGDHLKAASDRGLALAGVGLFYHQGYFRQVLGEDGWQMELYPDHDPAGLPVEPVRDRRGGHLTLELAYPGRRVSLRVWRAVVGRVPLYLLDTDFEANEPADRELTRRLYGGDRDLRLRQEILLGIGGLRVLRALGLRPAVCHLNEGHAAFLALERIRELMQAKQLSFGEARLAAAPGLVFTTHTPVPAGNDAFAPGMIDHYFGEYFREMQLQRAEFLAIGRQNPYDESEPFSMTILALRLCGASNAVSQLHGVVARRMWHGIWPDLPVDAVPIGSVTNGVHMPSWIAPALFRPHRERACHAERSADRLSLADLSDAELWARHEALRGRLIDFARARLVVQRERRGAGPSELSRAARILDPHCLTIGFARRFAGYKRATLLLGEPERLSQLLNDPQRPIQFVFAGKAHPHDDPGKELIRQLFEQIALPIFRHRMVFIEDYDLNVARYLVQGVDVWLNTPRRPLEASGTSGMKAIANGALHLSTLDGWWDEAFRPGLGWAIGDRRDYADPAEQDAVDRESLFYLLEREVVPLFYERQDGIPQGWLAMMRASMTELTARFSTERMLGEYDEQYYQPATALAPRLTDGAARSVRRLSTWLQRVESAWPGVRIERLEADSTSLSVGAPLRVEAQVELGGLEPADVAAHLLIGPLDESGELVSPREVPLHPRRSQQNGRARFRSDPLQLETSGTLGLLVRVMPRHSDLLLSQALGRARWGP